MRISCVYFGAFGFCLCLKVKQNCSRRKFLAANPELEALNNKNLKITAPFIVSAKICAMQTEGLSREKGK